MHYGELQSDWSYLPHLDDFHEQWFKHFEDHVARRQADEARDPELRWVTPHVAGMEVPRRDNPSLSFWKASPAT